MSQSSTLTTTQELPQIKELQFVLIKEFSIEYVMLNVAKTFSDYTYFFTHEKFFLFFYSKF